jgi:ABC-2 type transport system permease protein
MRSFSDEIRLGTIEILKTKPISNWEIVLGKYLGSFILIILALIPTLTYVYTVNQLGNPIGNLDFGSTLGSYFGLLFLASTFTSIGLFASALSNNQIVSFIIGGILCFILFYGFDAMSELISFDDFQLANLGMNAHFKSISRGVIDSNDIVYFISVSYLFLYLTKLKFD